jgi:hypothetical protein
MLEICLPKREPLAHDAPLTERLKHKDYEAHFYFRTGFRESWEKSFADVYQTQPEADFWEKEWKIEFTNEVHDKFGGWKSLNKNDCWILYEESDNVESDKIRECDEQIADLGAKDTAHSPEHKEPAEQAPAIADRRATRVRIFNEACLEVKDFYGLVKGSKRDMSDGKWEEAAMYVLEEHNDWRHITCADIEGKISLVNKTPRDVIGRILKSILDRKGFPPGNFEKLYSEYKKTVKGLKKD